VALVINDKPFTFERLRRGLIYRLGAVPRGEVTETYVEPVLAGKLGTEYEQIEMLRLMLDVQATEVAEVRDNQRLVCGQLDRVAEVLSSMGAMCQALAAACARLDIDS